jgi:hypothetical protein
MSVTDLLRAARTALSPLMTAFDASATAVDSATMTVANTPETLHLTGSGITTLLVDAPQDETLILELCAR